MILRLSGSPKRNCRNRRNQINTRLRFPFALPGDFESNGDSATVNGRTVLGCSIFYRNKLPAIGAITVPGAGAECDKNARILAVGDMGI